MGRKYLERPNRRVSFLRAKEFIFAEDLIIHGFMLKVEKKSEDKCWIWKGSVGHNGYGKFAFLNKVWLPHRVSWLLFKGPIPKGMFLCHKCDIPLCVNPEHLFLGTPKENTQDMIRKNRWMGGPIGRRKRYKCDENASNAKLTNEQVRFIRKSNLSSVTLAKQFNVTPPTIQFVKRRISFKDVLDVEDNP